MLRLHDEPCVYLDEVLVHRILLDHIDELCTRMRTTLTGLGDPGAEAFGGKDLFYFDDAPGDLRVMPYHDGATMTVKIIGTNEAGTVVPDKISVGKAVVIHPQDHHVMGILDVAALSSIRRAIGILLAWQALNHGGPKPNLGVVGAGRVGAYTALAFQRAGLIDSCVAYDSNPVAVQRMHELCELESGPRVRAAATLPHLLAESDAVALTSAAQQPLLGRADVDKYALRFVGSVVGGRRQPRRTRGRRARRGSIAGRQPTVLRAR
ncbi:hypothetical protein [Actinokineospora sp.]|uniref:hypothetical protein n=1 Tax=Actinokineospora sp. TaxID=1872133 RepID=UPI003D6A0A12